MRWREKALVVAPTCCFIHLCATAFSLPLFFSFSSLSFSFSVLLAFHSQTPLPHLTQHPVGALSGGGSGGEGGIKVDCDGWLACCHGDDFLPFQNFWKEALKCLCPLFIYKLRSLRERECLSQLSYRKFGGPKLAQLASNQSCTALTTNQCHTWLHEEC